MSPVEVVTTVLALLAVAAAIVSAYAAVAARREAEHANTYAYAANKLAKDANTKADTANRLAEESNQLAKAAAADLAATRQSEAWASYIQQINRFMYFDPDSQDLNALITDCNGALVRLIDSLTLEWRGWFPAWAEAEQYLGWALTRDRRERRARGVPQWGEPLARWTVGYMTNLRYARDLGADAAKSMAEDLVKLAEQGVVTVYLANPDWGPPDQPLLFQLSTDNSGPINDIPLR